MARQLTGSLQNRMLEGYRGQPEPAVGMDCTEVMYSDRAPFQISRVELRKDGTVKRFWMKPKDVKILDYFAEKYEIGEVREDAHEVEAKQKRSGQWVTNPGGVAIHLGHASFRDDPSF